MFLRTMWWVECIDKEGRGFGRGGKARIGGKKPKRVKKVEPTTLKQIFEDPSGLGRNIQQGALD